MEDISIYLDPIKKAESLKAISSAGSIGDAMVMNTEGKIDFRGHRLALVGVLEGRGTTANEGCALGVHKVREQLYPLFHSSPELRMLDLGDIKAGHTLEDTLFAVEQVCTELIRRDIVPMVIGGGHLMTLGMYRAYSRLERMCNTICIDPRFDLGDADAPLGSDNFLSEMILHKPNFLFNHSVIAYQKYLVNQEMTKMMDKMFFDVHRLGETVSDLNEIEAVIRSGDMLSIDISSVRHSDAPGVHPSLPNGLYGEQLCQLCAYAGLSEKASCIGFFEFNPSYDQAEQTSQLIAQALWCFIDGFYHRHKEEVGMDEEHFTKYRVLLQEQYEVVFHKSRITDRWWMEIPYPNEEEKRFKRYHMVPCSYQDYKTALEEEMPDRWWQTYQKLQ